MFRKAKTLRDPDSLRSFIYSFAVRVLKAELRRRKIRGWLPFMPEAPLDFGFLTVDVEARDLPEKALCPPRSPVAARSAGVRPATDGGDDRGRDCRDHGHLDLDGEARHRRTPRPGCRAGSTPTPGWPASGRSARRRDSAPDAPTIPNDPPALVALTALGRDAGEPHTQAELDEGFRALRRRVAAARTRRRALAAVTVLARGRGVCRARAPGRAVRAAAARAGAAGGRRPDRGRRPCWKADICPSRAARTSP